MFLVPYDSGYATWFRWITRRIVVTGSHVTYLPIQRLHPGYLPVDAHFCGAFLDTIDILVAAVISVMAIPDVGCVEY